MATSVPPSEVERQRCIDLDAVRRHWARNARLLPNFKLFREPELWAAVSLGIDALVRNSRPGTIQIQLKACYDRLVGGSLVKWEDVLGVAEYVYQHAISRPDEFDFRSTPATPRIDTVMIDDDLDGPGLAWRSGSGKIGAPTTF